MIATMIEHSFTSTYKIDTHKIGLYPIDKAISHCFILFVIFTQLNYSKKYRVTKPYFYYN